MNDFQKPRPFRDASTRYAKHGPIEGMEYRAPLGRSLAILLVLGVIGWAAIAALIAGVMS